MDQPWPCDACGHPDFAIIRALARILGGCGLAVMASIWTAAALLGLQAVFVLFPWAYVIMKTAGALYLIYIAYGMWRHASEPLAMDAKPAVHAFRTGLMINVLNPKSVLFAGAVLLVIFPQHIAPLEKAIIVLNHLLVEIVLYGILCVAMSAPYVRGRYLAAKTWMDRGASIVLGALGLRLLLSR